MKKRLGHFFEGKIFKFGKNDKPNLSFKRDLDQMFYPKSIAIVGASANKKKLGSIVVQNIIDSKFEGDIFPLNLKSTSILGLKTYKDYNELPKTPDLALIAIPAKFVLEILEKIIKKGTKNVVIFSAGFKEIGQEGLILERKLLKLIEENNINLLGPNCLGYINNLAPVNVTFGQVIKKKGNLRFISQSGAIASSIFDWAEGNNIGFSEFVTLGNKTDLNENDILKYFFAHDISSRTKEEGSSNVVPIGMYLESIVDGEEFVKIASKISKRDPIFVLKPGKSIESRKAMQSHTGSIAGEDYVFNVALKKAGVLRCDGIEDFFDLAKVFAWEKTPIGKNIAIISNAGGPAVLSSDFVAQEGLQLVHFDHKTVEELEMNLPRSASVLNPVDVLGDALAERYKSAIKTLIVNENVHSLLIILTPQVMTQIEKTARVIGNLSLEYGKPIVCAFMGGNHVAKGERILNGFKIPSFRYPERAVKAIAKMYEWSQLRKNIRKQDRVNANVNVNKSADKIISNVINSGRKTLDNFEANQILKLYGINTPPTAQCKSITDAKNFVNKNNFPVVLKISSPDLLHKSDEGGVIIGIDSEEKLANSFRKLEEIKDNLSKTNSHSNHNHQSSSIQIQKQVSKGLEIIIGSKFDSIFGNVIMFGAGGVLANLIEDRNLGLVPLEKTEIMTMIKNSKIYKLLKGYRGERSYDLSKIVDLILKLQSIIISNKEISEIDINPVIFNEDGIWAVDGKVIF